MKKLTRLVAIMAATVLGASALTGCAASQAPVSAPSEDAAADSPAADAPATEAAAADPNSPTWKQSAGTAVDFDWYINFSWFARSWGNDMTSKYITDKTGVNIEYVVPAGNEAEKINTMIASDTLSDFITLDWGAPQVKEMIDADLVWSLDELAEQYDPYFNTVADKLKLDWYRMEDGHVYGYPNASYSPADYEKYADKMESNQTFLVRKDIYEAIGSPDMSTPDGFIAALEKAQEMYPTVNNQPLIPVGFTEFQETTNQSLEAYLMNFLAVPYEKDGKIYDRYTDPEYIAWLKTLRLANEKGLIAKDIFIDKRAQMEEKIAQGRYFAMLYQAQDMISQNSALYNADPNSCYIAIDGPKNSAGDPHTLSGTGIGGWTLTMISKQCEDPARAIQFLSYLISEEGQHDIKLGPQELWATQDGRDLITPEYNEINMTDKERWENEFGADDTHWMLMDNAMQLQWTMPYAEPLRQAKEWSNKYVVYTGQYDNIDPDADSQEYVDQNKIKLKWMQILPQLMTAPDDAAFDTLFKEFTDYRDTTNFAAIEAIRTQKMEVNKGKLGL